MIKIKKIERDFTKIQSIIKYYLPNNIVKKLEESISNNIKEIIIELPYVDKDFRDTYYNDFSKRFAKISRDSIRLHLFFEKDKIESSNYGGFITLRDTKTFTLGRSYLNPKAIKYFINGFYRLTTFKVNLLGQELKVEAFPWMQQDGNVSRCAHIATWSVMRFFTERYPFYAEKTLYQIKKLNSLDTRITPSKGLTVNQVAKILSSSGFSSEIYLKDTYSSYEYYNNLIYTFIESGSPIVAGLLDKKHAIVIIGHGELNYDNLENGINNSSKLIDSLIVIDDNNLPYTSIERINHSKKYNINDIGAFIVPFYEKMYLTVDSVYSKILPKLEKETFDFKDDKIIRRVFLSSSKSFKSFIFNNSLDERYKELIIYSQMPSFIWIIEYATILNYKKGFITHRVILDATQLEFYADSFLNIKNGKNYLKPNREKPTLLNKFMDKMYINNLVEIKRKEN